MDKITLRANFDFEKKYWEAGFDNIAGVDEAGRGCLAGPVIAAAVILPKNIIIPKLDDSKKLSSKTREKLFPIIKEKAISYGIGIVDNNVIDKINILQATYRAMRLALYDLYPKPNFVLVDGRKIPELKFPQLGIIKGDSKSLSIAAASVLAKVTRDNLMVEFSQNHPVYKFEKNKGYGTKEHLSALKTFGICNIHRKSFEPIKSDLDKQLKFFKKSSSIKKTS